MNYKFYFRAVLFLGIFFISNFANAESGAITDIDCGKTSSKIISVCSDENHSCASQQWIIGDHFIDLKKINSDDFVLVRWACLPSSNGEKIIFTFVNWGNCEACERFNIWTPDGEQITEWQKFSQDYKSLGFPQVKGRKFSEQFLSINRNNKTDKK